MKPKQVKYTMFLPKLRKPCFHLHLLYCTNHGKTNFFQNSHFFKVPSKDTAKTKNKENIQIPCSVQKQNFTFSLNRLFILLKTVFPFWNQSKLRQLITLMPESLSSVWICIFWKHCLSSKFQNIKHSVWANSFPNRPFKLFPVLFSLVERKPVLNSNTSCTNTSLPACHYAFLQTKAPTANIASLCYEITEVSKKTGSPLLHPLNIKDFTYKN